jgi:hypothetical protein
MGHRDWRSDAQASEAFRRPQSENVDACPPPKFAAERGVQIAKCSAVNQSWRPKVSQDTGPAVQFRQARTQQSPASK